MDDESYAAYITQYKKSWIYRNFVLFQNVYKKRDLSYSLIAERY